MWPTKTYFPTSSHLQDSLLHLSSVHRLTFWCIIRSSQVNLRGVFFDKCIGGGSDKCSAKCSAGGAVVAADAGAEGRVLRQRCNAASCFGTKPQTLFMTRSPAWSWTCIRVHCCLDWGAPARHFFIIEKHLTKESVSNWSFECYRLASIGDFDGMDCFSDLCGFLVVLAIWFVVVVGIFAAMLHVTLVDCWWFREILVFGHFSWFEWHWWLMDI